MTNHNTIIKLKLLKNYYRPHTYNILGIYNMHKPHIIKKNKNIKVLKKIKSLPQINLLYKIPNSYYITNNILKYWSNYKINIISADTFIHYHWWIHFLKDINYLKRFLWILKNFKITQNRLLHIIFMLINKQEIHIWQYLKIILYRAKPNMQRRLIMQYIRFIDVLFLRIGTAANIIGYTIKIKGKINRAGSVRKKQIKARRGQTTMFNSEIKFLPINTQATTPAGALGISLNIFYKDIYE